MESASTTAEEKKFLDAGWEPFAVVAVPAAGGTMAAVVYFRKKIAYDRVKVPD